MTPSQLKAVLKQTGMPVEKIRFKSPPAPPYLVYAPHNSSNLMADGKVIFSASRYKVELYTKKADDTESENAVEGVFTQNNTPFESFGTIWIASLELYQTIYTVPIYGK